jgi:hypothetical protein
VEARPDYDGYMADVWAVGVLHVFAFTGKLPFIGANVEIMQQRVVEGDLQLSEDMSSEARAVAVAVLRVEPRRRMPLPEVMITPCYQRSGPRRETDSSEQIPDAKVGLRRRRTGQYDYFFSSRQTSLRP